MANRAKAYAEGDLGLSQAAAAVEARLDLLREGEAKVREEAVAELRHRERLEVRRIGLERMKVARELVRLQAAYEGFAASGLLAGSDLRGFDTDLVGRLKRETWYDAARESAFNILQIEADDAANRAVAFRQQLRGQMRRNMKVAHVVTEHELRQLGETAPRRHDGPTPRQFQ